MLVRGKDTGHDIDLLISHPEEGKEKGLLQQLISVLESHDVLLHGRWERSTFSAEDAVSDVMMTSKPSNLKNTLDHFEKWIGIVKVNARFHLDKDIGSADEETAKCVNSKCQKYLYCNVLDLCKFNR